MDIVIIVVIAIVVAVAVAGVLSLVGSRRRRL